MPIGAFLIRRSQTGNSGSAGGRGHRNGAGKSLRPLIAEGRLIHVWQDWCPSFPAIFSTARAVAIRLSALAALIKALHSPSWSPMLLAEEIANRERQRALNRQLALSAAGVPETRFALLSPFQINQGNDKLR